MSEFEQPEKKRLFKKKSLRPWHTQELEDNLTASPEAREEAAIDHLQNIKTQLERTLAEKTREKDDLNKQIDPFPGAISFGGLITPTNMVLHQEESLLKSKTIITELKDKEQEILELTTNLKTTQALEHAQLAEFAREAEERARIMAEEKAKTAFMQAEKAQEMITAANIQAREALKQAEKSEQLRLKELEHKIALEEKLRSAIRQVQHAEETRLEAEKLKNLAEEKIQFALEHAAAIERNAKDHVFVAESKLKQAEWEVMELSKSQAELSLEQQNLEQKFISLAEENKITAEKLRQEMELREFNEYRVEELIEEINQLKVQETKLKEAFLHIDKLETIIKNERGLRKLYEEKANYALEQAYNAELLRKAEEQTRKLAEDKAKRAVEQASKAVMHFLNNEEGKLN